MGGSPVRSRKTRRRSWCGFASPAEAAGIEPADSTLGRSDLAGAFASVAAIGYRDIELPNLYGKSAAEVRALAAQGRKAYIIPGGGSNALGGLGYVVNTEIDYERIKPDRTAKTLLMVALGAAVLYGGARLLQHQRR